MSANLETNPIPFPVARFSDLPQKVTDGDTPGSFFNLQNAKPCLNSRQSRCSLVFLLGPPAPSLRGSGEGTTTVAGVRRQAFGREEISREADNQCRIGERDLLKGNSENCYFWGASPRADPGADIISAPEGPRTRKLPRRVGRQLPALSRKRETRAESEGVAFAQRKLRLRRIPSARAPCLPCDTEEHRSFPPWLFPRIKRSLRKKREQPPRSWIQPPREDTAVL